MSPADPAATTAPTATTTADAAGARPTATCVADLAACRDAEHYFAALGVPYDPRTLLVLRLHVLKEYARRVRDLPRPDDLAGHRAALAAAYADLVERGPLGVRTFQVLRTHAPSPFVPLEVDLDGAVPTSHPAASPSTAPATAAGPGPAENQ